MKEFIQLKHKINSAGNILKNMEQKKKQNKDRLGEGGGGDGKYEWVCWEARVLLVQRYHIETAPQTCTLKYGGSSSKLQSTRLDNRIKIFVIHFSKCWSWANQKLSKTAIKHLQS